MLSEVDKRLRFPLELDDDSEEEMGAFDRGELFLHLH